MLSGQSDKAQSLGQHAVDLARMYKERGNEAYALRLLAEVASMSCCWSWAHPRKPGALSEGQLTLWRRAYVSG